MSQFQTITEFNTYLSDKLRNIKLNEYFNLIHSQFYSNIDISFMDYFLELTNNENEFIVKHIKLQEYKVINNLITSANIKKNLERLMLIENEDYQVFQVEQQDLKNKHGGNNAKEYKLTPYAFKLCLIRSKNSKQYAKYYLLLEQVFKNYQEYQIMYQKVLLSGKDDKIDEMKETINNQNKKIDELLNYAKDTKEKNNELLDNIDELKDNIEDLNNTVDDIKEQNDDLKDTMVDIKEAFKETADRSVPNPTNNNERHEFILLQHKELINRFKFIRGIQKYNDSKIQKKYSEYNIIKREYNANPIQLFKLFKDTIKEYYKLEKAKITANKQLKNKTKLKKEIEKIKFIGNDIELQYNYTLNDLLNKITEINNERFNEYNDCP
jgi:uncharacterized coiled-coil DUF342 family protein